MNFSLRTTDGYAPNIPSLFPAGYFRIKKGTIGCEYTVWTIFKTCYVILMQKTKFKKLEKPKGGPMAKSEKTTGGTLGKSKNVRYFFVKNISFNPKNAFPHSLVDL